MTPDMVRKWSTIQHMTENMFTDTISGVVERVTYFNVENGYSVLKVAAENARGDAVARDGTVAVVGTLPQLNVGEAAEFKGEWREDPKWGLQFRAEQVRPILPTSKRGITRYLAEIVTGVGPKSAERIVEHFGEKTLDVLNRTPERLFEVKGLRDQQAEKIIETWQQNAVEREVLIFLQGYGVTSRFARRIYDAYGDTTIQVVQSNPYQLADDVFGVGFIKADDIAKSMDWGVESPERISAGLSYALSRLAQEGHTYAPRDVLVETTAELLKLSNIHLIDTVVAQRVTQDLVKSEMLVVEGAVVEAIYLPIYYNSERGIVRLLRQALAAAPVLAQSQAHDLDGYVTEIVEASDVQLTDQQRGAIKAALMNKLSVLTGGPGTGKTTTLRMVIEAVEELGHKVSLAAPTGRAAKRLSEATQRPASTIHRLLGFQPGGGNYFEHDEDNPLETDMLVLDETSMLDVVLFYNVLKALPPYAHLMLVGDVDQLPSVGAGNVLRDVIDSGVAHVTRLDRIFRQDARSHIVANAHAINTGSLPYLANDSDDFFFFRMNTPAEAAEMVVDVVVNRVPQKFNFDPIQDVQVLAPMYKGPVGVNALNNALQAALNPADQPRPKAYAKHKGVIFRVGDKVMQTKNNYDKGVFNGDGGRIYSIDKDANELEVWFEDQRVDYAFSELDQLVLSYCISTHRSQGSEYPVVVMPVVTQHYVMLQRNLLYTAITRARKLVVLVGMDKAVGIAVGNNKVADRYSGLLPRLRALALP